MPVCDSSKAATTIQQHTHLSQYPTVHQETSVLQRVTTHTAANLPGVAMWWQRWPSSQ